MRVLTWSAQKLGVRWSTNTWCLRRFAILETTFGYTVVDREANDESARTTTLACAQAWAGIRVGETVVRGQTELEREHHKEEEEWTDGY